MEWSRMIAASMIVTLYLPAAIHADDAVARGAAAVDQWCRMCHLRTSNAPDPDMAPTFEEIVQWEGRDEVFFARFMQEDRFPMTGSTLRERCCLGIPADRLVDLSSDVIDWHGHHVFLKAADRFTYRPAINVRTAIEVLN